MVGANVIFWVAVALLAYTYAGYPLMVWILSMLRPDPCRKARIVPAVSIVVVAHNEAACIRRKIENLLALDYPENRAGIIVASDGSTDATAAIAHAAGGSCIAVHDFRQRRGKSAVLNELIPSASGEIVVLTDARQRIESGALRELVASFADPRVGVVGGELLLKSRHDSEVAEGMDTYWRYEKFIRHCESAVDSTIGASGAFYALRREAFRPISPEIILDDVAIPMAIARQGYRVVLEPLARACDEIAATADAEFNRKVRTIAGNFQLFGRQPWLLLPFANRLWFQTVSHKLLRLLSPFCLLTALVANGFLLHLPSFRLLLSIQVMFYGAALAGRIVRGRASKLRFLGIPYAFCLLNYATLVAMLRILANRQKVTWERTAL